MTDLSSVPVGTVYQWLRHDKRAFAEGVARGRYAFWLGSAISLDQVPGLAKVIAKVIEHLTSRADLSDANDAFTKALWQILRLSDLEDYQDLSSLDLSLPLSQWPRWREMIGRLCQNYSRVFGTAVGGDSDYLLWTAADFLDTYAAVTDPGDEHLCLAILVSQGAVSELVSGNWDPLIEIALSATDPEARLVPCVTAEDLQTGLGMPRLLKFHGCAQRALHDPVKYKPYLVVTDDQIGGYRRDTIHALMYNSLVTLCSVTNTLMIGLSAQDDDIRDVFEDASAIYQPRWRDDPPRFIFSGADATQDQRGIIKGAYGAAEYWENAAEIDQRSTIAAYAKPLLKALVLSAELDKVRGYLGCCGDYSLNAGAMDSLVDYLELLFESIATWADVAGDTFVRSYVELHGSLLGQFRASPGASWRGYVPIDRKAVDHIAMSPTRTTDGLREFAAALAVLGGARSRGVRLHILPAKGPSSPRLITRSATGTSTVIFAAGEDVVASLIAAGRLDPADSTLLVVTSTSAGTKTTRSPIRRPGRTGRAGMRRASMRDLLVASSSDEDLIDGFLQGAGL